MMGNRSAEWAGAKIIRVQEAKATEGARVTAMIEAEADQVKTEANDRAWREKSGLPPRVRPSEHVAARRAARSNGMPAEETEDTIGRLWAWGFLDGSQFAADLLRDAGRRYAASYWRRYGPVCAGSGHYEEMTGRSGSGPSMVVIPDEAKDILAEERFQRRDLVLRLVKAKVVIDQACVDGAGDNDPAWLSDMINGFPAETRQERIAFDSTEAIVRRAESGDGSLEWASRRHGEAARALQRKIRQSRIDIVPHGRVSLIVLGLAELARVDRAEGLHRPKRQKKEKDE